MSGLPEGLLRELLVTFHAEAQERLAAANRAMLALESTADPTEVRTLIADLFREVHNLKGASAALGLTEIQALSHDLESTFERSRDGAVLSRPEHDRIYRALDELAALVERSCEAPPSPAGGAAPEQGEIRGEAPVPEGRAPSPLGRERAEPAPHRAGAGDDTVRVATAKLDALMGQVGELMAATAATERYADELTTVHSTAQNTGRAWRDVRPAYRRLAADLRDANGSGVLLSPVAVRQLEALLAHVRIADSRSHDLVRTLGALRADVKSELRRTTQVVTALQDEVRRTRMLPVESILRATPRAVRDLARRLGKEVALEIVGGDIEVDRSVLEHLKDPLNHLIRNAIDHGLEAPDERVRRNKPREASLRVAARQRGDSIEIEVADDGAGINVHSLRTVAVEKGLVTEDEAAAMAERDALELIFGSGFSTSSTLTDISGRGVGLDVVRDAVERIGGLVELTTEPGRGSRFRVTVPLSIATTDCLFMRAGDQTVALPVTNIARIVRVDPAAVGRAAGRQTVVVEDRPIPLLHLADVVGFERDDHESGRLQAIVIGTPDNRVALLVESFEGAREVVIKGLPAPLYKVPFAAGAAITAGGDVVFVLNAGDLTRAIEAGPVRRTAVVAETPTRPVVLIADDSIVTRTLEKSILEAAGYEVRVASDGLEAWTVLESQAVDVLVSDVEMPGLDGFELTERVRADERFATMPVLLVTSLDSREHRERGAAAGADAHIAKHAFDQTRLLEAIRRLI